MDATWNAILARLERLDGVESTVHDNDGTVRVVFACSMARVGEVLACLPGEHERTHEQFTELFDHTGEGVDYELECGLYACAAERTIFTYADHWQAGLSGEVLKAPSNEAFQQALQQCIAAAQEQQDEGTDGLSELADVEVDAIGHVLASERPRSTRGPR